MATLNAAAHLPGSLDSLVGQDLRDFEVILVDGGSGDKTCELAANILESACIRHRIFVVPGSGIYDAINHGFSEAKGEWVYVMGADDRLLNPEVFAAMAPYLQHANRQALVVHGDVWIEDPGYRYGQIWDLPRFLDRNISHQSAFYRRRAIESLGIRYNQDYPLYADWDYNLRLFAIGKFLYVPLAVASYGCGGSSSLRKDERFLADKERNARHYFGWRSVYLMPPHRFSLSAGQGFRPFFRAQLILNRLIWLLKRCRLIP